MTDPRRTSPHTVGRLVQVSRIRPSALIAAAVVALLSGCGGHAGGQPTTPPPAASLSPTAAPSEGPATVTHTWPDGFTARIVSLTRINVADLKRIDPNMDAPPAGTTLVKLTVALGNTGSAPVPLPRDQFLWHVLTSPNRMQAQDYGGDQFTGPSLTSQAPEQVAPGQTVTLFDSWNIPTADLSTVAVRVDLGGTVEPYTFTGVQVTGS